MPVEIAPDDIVRTAAEAAANGREPLVLVEPLCAFLDAHGIGSGEPQLTAIGEGHSNVTYAVRRGAAEFVLRRPPRGPLLPSTHDMLREVRVLRALAGRARVPRVLAACENASVIGAPFYVMELVVGHVVTAAVPPALDAHEERRRIGEQLVDALVEVHAVDWQAVGLAQPGSGSGYLERQVRRFAELWRRSRTRQVPDVEEVGAWLAAHIPASPPPTIVHGDYRLGNAIIGPSAPAQVVAILDWEMSTIGDPLADVGYLLASYARPGDAGNAIRDLGDATRDDGFPEREELAERYAAATGRPVHMLAWYCALALWKAAIFLEASYRRWREGTTDDAYFAGLEPAVPRLAAQAVELCRGRAI